MRYHRALCYFGQDFFLLGEIFVIGFFKEKEVAGVVFQGGSSVGDYIGICTHCVFENCITIFATGGKLIHNKSLPATFYHSFYIKGNKAAVWNWYHIAKPKRTFDWIYLVLGFNEHTVLVFLYFGGHGHKVAYIVYFKHCAVNKFASVGVCYIRYTGEATA